jgi:mannosyltransferase
LRRHYRDPLQGGPNAGYMQALQHIEAHAQPSDGIITITPYQYDFPMNHYRGRLPILGLARAEPPLEEGMVTLLERTLSVHRRLWLVTAGIQPADPTNGVEEWLAQHAFKASDEWYGDFRLCLYGSPGELSEPIPLDIQLGPDISLRGYQIVSQSGSPGQILSLALHWQALAQPDRNHKVFVQLLNPEGQLVAQRDSQPLDGFRPTSTWRPGQEITDRYGLLIPDTLPPGAYPLVIGMYDVETGQRLKVSGRSVPAGSDVVPLTEIRVSDRSPR